MAAGKRHQIRVISCPPMTGGHGSAEVLLVGEFDIASEAELAGALLGVARSEHAIHVDLTQVSFLDVATVRLLVAACARVREIGGAFSVTCGIGLPRRVIEVLGVYDYLEAEKVPFPLAEVPSLSA